MARDVLIAWGGLETHEPEKTAQIIRTMLEGEGLSVDVTADIGAFGDPDLALRRLVIPNITGGAIEREALDNLMGAVRGGVGLGGHHHALATTFREAYLFHYMTGCLFVGHPGNVRDFRVDVTRPDDPVMAGIESFDYRSEQYYMLVDPTLEVLATTTFDGVPDPAARGAVIPVVYKRRFEQGRVFYSALGHKAAEFDRPQTRTILLRGLLWAARLA
ncbi:hypothetical protein EMQ25_06480 [Arsenicitalea aurantiaca]|uniref:ThuA-like domain-containing protein n=1 Tax=Arsenicitalea aurantiaca TaxID=1783274 RepID=A0A433XFC2_9HYPH|nr:ThuA domain-containing protein [Arsenicitalea aurantiaca]RUT32785.1 hypothetical protein EMQ25_06480 [Arsenicitalea aurantiaca]